MNENEAVDVVTFIAAPYNRPVDAALVAAWFHVALAPLEVAEAMDTAVDLLNIETYMPTPASFVEARRAASQVAYREAQDAVPAMRALVAGGRSSADDEIAAAAISQMRGALATLAQDGPRGHWHGGPDPCRVCGGIRPGLRR